MGQVEVYRIETESGGGPYTGLEDGMDLAIHLASNGPTHPGPHKDGCDDGVALGFVCGFRDVDQGRRWFGASVELARAINRRRRELFVSVYDVPEMAVVRGDRQVMFDRDAATLVERLPVEYLTSWAFRHAATN